MQLFLANLWLTSLSKTVLLAHLLIVESKSTALWQIMKQTPTTAHLGEWRDQNKDCQSGPRNTITKFETRSKTRSLTKVRQMTIYSCTAVIRSKLLIFSLLSVCTAITFSLPCARNSGSNLIQQQCSTEFSIFSSVQRHYAINNLSLNRSI